MKGLNRNEANRFVTLGFQTRSAVFPKTVLHLHLRKIEDEQNYSYRYLVLWFYYFRPNYRDFFQKKLLKHSSMLSGAGYFPKCLFSWSFSPSHSSPHGQTAQGQTTPTAFFTCLISHHIKPQYLGTNCILINMVRKIKLSLSHPYVISIRAHARAFLL